MPGEIDNDEPVISPLKSPVPTQYTGMAGAAQSPDIPVAHPTTQEWLGEQDALSSPLNRSSKCHCGRESCAWLRHSNELVEDLERDVRQAGELGQVCGAFLKCSVLGVLGVFVLGEVGQGDKGGRSIGAGRGE